MARMKSLMLRYATHYSTYVGRKTTTLWTFQDRIQGTPEAGIRLYNTGQLAPGFTRSLLTAVAKNTRGMMSTAESRTSMSS